MDLKLCYFDWNKEPKDKVKSIEQNIIFLTPFFPISEISSVAVYVHYKDYLDN